MSNKRPLTAEEKAMADRMKAIFEANPNLTQEAVGAAVGVTQGTVWQWIRGEMPVSAKRAPALAEALGIEDPSEISVAYRDISGAPSTSTQVHVLKASHASRFNPRILAATHKALRELYDEELHSSFNIEEEPEQFLLAYELHSALDKKAPGADPVEIFRAAGLARGVGAAANARFGDGRVGVPDEGAHSGKMAGKVQRKKG